MPVQQMEWRVSPARADEISDAAAAGRYEDAVAMMMASRFDPAADGPDTGATVGLRVELPARRGE